MLSQTSLSQISMHIQKYLFPLKRLSFETEFNNQFNSLILAIKCLRAQIKDGRYSEGATESQISILSFFSKSLKNTCEKVRFWQCCRLQACSFAKKGIRSQAFLKDFVNKCSWQNFKTAALKIIFSLRTLPVAASVYANNFLKKTKEVNILKV